MSPRFHKWLKAMLTIAMVSAPFAEDSAFANKCTDQIIQKCQGNASASESSVIAGTGGGSITQRSGSMGSQLTQQGNNTLNQAVDCANTFDECQKCKQKDKSTSDDEVKQCQKQVNAQAQDMANQGQQMKKSGSDMSAIAGMMAGVAGAALGYMMAKQQQKQNQTPPTPPPPVAYGALQLNGTLNCQMADSYQYADCANYLTQVCAPATQAATALAAQTTPTTGTIISSPGGVAAQPNCAAFNETYCSSSVTPPQADGYQRLDGVVTQVNLAGTGGGLGSPYCANTVATAWCSDAMYGASRAMCPSCLQMNTATSLACAQNPSLCLAQNTGTVAAGLPSSCAGDPLYTAGSPYSSGAGVLATTGVPTVGVPAVMLPQNATLGNSGNKASGTSGSGATGLPSTSLAGASTAHLNGAAREAASVPSGSQLRALSMEQIMAVAHSKGPNELFGAGGVVIANGSSFVSRGPASDVSSAFGPSLFTTSTAVIRHHCQEGRLNNCK